MANTITVTKIVDGARNLMAHVYVLGDGSGDESSATLIDASALTPPATNLRVTRIQGYLRGGWTASVLQSGSSDGLLAVLPADDQFEYCFDDVGVGNEIATAGTGDIDITTASLGNGDTGVFTIWAEKTTA